LRLMAGRRRICSIDLKRLIPVPILKIVKLCQVIVWRWMAGRRRICSFHLKILIPVLISPELCQVIVWRLMADRVRICSYHLKILIPVIKSRELCQVIVWRWMAGRRRICSGGTRRGWSTVPPQQSSGRVILPFIKFAPTSLWMRRKSGEVMKNGTGRNV
jgi:hypothetical protein